MTDSLQSLSEQRIRALKPRNRSMCGLIVTDYGEESMANDHSTMTFESYPINNAPVDRVLAESRASENQLMNRSQALVGIGVSCSNRTHSQER